LALHVFLVALTLAIFGFLLDANLRINKKRAEISSQISFLEKELRALEQKKQEYEFKISKAQTDEFWEEKLREQGYKKPGESVFVVIPPKEGTSSEPTKKKIWWQSFLEMFGF
jgi:cell division protein FtsB